jgi:hypothetical protein
MIARSSFSSNKQVSNHSPNIQSQVSAILQE